MNLTDPTGLYVTTCGTGDTKCQKDAAAFEAARQMSLESSDPEIRQAAEAFGDPGVDNGVVVSFGDPGKGRLGTATSDVFAKSDHTQMVTKSQVVIKSGLKGTKLRSVVAHEGSHVADAQAFAASFDMSSGKYDLSLNLTSYETEVKAFMITHSIYKTANEKFKPGCGKECFLGTTQRTEADARRAIDRILADPNGAYKVNSQDPGGRLIPRFNGKE